MLGCRRWWSVGGRPAVELLRSGQFWHHLNPGRPLPPYSRPRPPRPDRHLRQSLDHFDEIERNEVLRLLDRAARRSGQRSLNASDKAVRKQKEHWRRTGRWLLGTPPPVPEWYEDPKGLFLRRFWNGKNWTEQVQVRPGEGPSVDPDFPTDEDIAAWERLVENWE